MIDGKGGERMESEISRLFSKADRYKDRIDAARPLSTREAKELSDYFKIGLTYSSNAIEGNTLTISETKVLLEDGLTVGGKPIKDYYEATGHGKAYEYMRALANSDAPITEAQILELHRLLYSLVDEDSLRPRAAERSVRDERSDPRALPAAHRFRSAETACGREALRAFPQRLSSQTHKENPY